MPEYYYRIKQLSTIRPQLVDLARVKEDEAKLLVRPSYTQNSDFPSDGGFYTYVVDRELASQDSVIKLILDTCGDKVSPEIWWLKPNVWYHWHRDGGTQCTINMILDVTRSHTWFGEPDHDDYKQLTELVYEPKDTLFLLDAQQSHCVANFSTPRSIFTMRLYAPWSYATIKDILQENNL